MGAPVAIQAPSFWTVTRAEGGAITPRTFSNGMDQEEAVRRIVTEFRRAKRRQEPTDVFFLAGTGSGKSIVALLTASKVGRAIITIPTVNLQSQYEADYGIGDGSGGGRIRVTRPDGRDLQLASVKGRTRYECTLEGGTAADAHPCNKSGKDAGSKWRVASECPKWSPIMPKETFHGLMKIDTGSGDPDLVDHHLSFLRGARDDAREYAGYEEEFVHVGEKGCPYFDAHLAFATADVVLLNNRKWQIETELGRKPMVDVEIFDEADSFLDGLFDMQRLSTDALVTLLERLDYPAKVLSLPEAALRDPARLVDFEADVTQMPAEYAKEFNAFRSLVRRLKTYESPKDFKDEKTWFALEGVFKLLREMPKRALERLQNEFQGYPWATIHVENVLAIRGVGTGEDDGPLARLRAFVENKESLVLAYDAEGVYFTYASFKAPLRNLLSRSAGLRLWMSATLPSPEILKRVYGFDNPVIIEGEPRFQGTLRIQQVPEAPPITFKTWQDDATKKAFARALESTMRRIPENEKLITIVFGKSRLEEIAPYSPTAAWMLKEVEADAEHHEDRLASFMDPAGPRHMVSTRIVRGVDFEGAKCRNIILLKDPIPNLSGNTFQVLRKKWPQPLFFSYASDIADRTLAQMIGRGLRAPGDWTRVWCMDAKLVPRIQRITAGKCEVVFD